MLELLFTFFRIGLLTFGGGYAMIPIMEREIITTHGWLTQAQFLDIVAIAEMTPGPISINAATFIGYQVAGVGGAAMATLGVVAPSLVIMIIFAHYLAKLKNSRYGIALEGITVGVVALIAAAVFTLFKPAIGSWTEGGIALVALGLALFTKISPIWIILAGGIAGVLLL